MVLPPEPYSKTDISGFTRFRINSIAGYVIQGNGDPDASTDAFSRLLLNHPSSARGPRRLSEYNASRSNLFSPQANGRRNSDTRSIFRSLRSQIRLSVSRSATVDQMGPLASTLCVPWLV